MAGMVDKVLAPAGAGPLDSSWAALAFRACRLLLWVCLLPEVLGATTEPVDCCCWAVSWSVLLLLEMIILVACRNRSVL